MARQAKKAENGGATARRAAFALTLAVPLTFGAGCTLPRRGPAQSAAVQPTAQAAPIQTPAQLAAPAPATANGPGPSSGGGVPVAYNQPSPAPAPAAGEIRLIADFSQPVPPAAEPPVAPAPLPLPLAAPAAVPQTAAGAPAAPVPPPDELTANALPIDLPTALHLVNANNLTVALAQERVREAMFQQERAAVLWLPDLTAGSTYNRYDGRDQNSNGTMFTVSKQNLFAGGTALLNWDTSQILFAPLIAQRETEAASASARAISSNTQLQAAQAYLDLLQVYGALAVNADTLARADAMAHNAETAEKAGLSKTTADINRAHSEVLVRRVERRQLEAQAGVVSARLAHLLLLHPSTVLKPADPKIVPVTFVEAGTNVDDLVATGLANRPELQAGSAEAAAAEARLRQARLEPFIPHLAMTYNGGTFGGGIDSQMSDFGGAGYGQASAYWELHNLGAGDVALARARQTQLNEASLELADQRAQVAEDVTAAFRDTQANWQNLESAQLAVQQALEAWRRLAANSFGLGGAEHQFDPLQPLIAERDLAQARTDYLNAVIEYDKSQVRLYWAMGQPPREGLVQLRIQSLNVPVTPPPYSEEIAPPQPPPAAPGR